MSLRTPPILLADRIGIFIFACFSYRERQATLQSSYQRTSTMLISQWKSKWSHKPSSAPPPFLCIPVARYHKTREATTLSWVLSLDSILTYISFSLQEQLQYKSYFIISFPILSNSILLPLQYTFLFHLEIHPQNLLPYSNNKLIHYSQKLLMKLY